MASLNFKGKNIIWNHHMSVPYHTLDLDEKLSYKQDEADGNLIIEGDNLPVLKSLLPQYTGKIDCIYIDPPYNTGKERWVYNDNVNSPLINDWIGKTVDKEDLTRHDKWLCMMVPRLKLMREFLSNEGAIFVSIDENELHHLINILNEIFGEQCYITTFIWNKKNGRQNDANYVSTNHEYIVCYCMNKEKYRMKKFPRKEVNNKEFSNPDNDSRGVWIHRPLHAKSGSVDSLYEVEFPNGVKWSVPKGTYPRFKKEDLLRMFNENKLWFGKTGKNVPRYKRFLTDVSKGIISNTILKADEVGSTQLSRQELQSLGLEEEFENTKPYQLISYLLTLSSNKESIILDAFAGSGTTAQAVLELNEEDKGNRKFILIQMPENTEKEPKKNIAR